MNIIRRLTTSIAILCTLVSHASVLSAETKVIMPRYEKAIANGSSYYFFGKGELDDETFDKVRLLQAKERIITGYKKLSNDSALEVGFFFDDTLSNIVLAAGAEDLGTAVLIDSKGREVDLSIHDFIVYSFKDQFIAKGSLPSGKYRLVVSGSGYSAATVFGSQESDSKRQNYKVVGIQFGTLENYLRYTQYVPLKRKAKSGENLQCSVLVNTAKEDFKFKFINRAGQVIGSLNLSPKSESSAGKIFRGKCKIPTEAFRVVAITKNKSDERSQRTSEKETVPAVASKKKS